MSPEIVAGLVGAAATAVLAILNSYLTSRAQVAEEVRKARLDAYPKLWRLTSLVSVWPRSDPRLEDLQGLQRDLRRWYFDVGGGLYMSENARDRYGQLQALLAAVIANYPKLQNDRGQPSDGTHLDLQESCSALRTALTEDLETRAQRSVLRSIRLLGRHFIHHRRGERRIARAARRPGEPVRLPIEDWQQPNRTLREAGAEPWWMRFRAVVARWRAGPRPAAGPGPGGRRRRRRGCG
jgi:hypothetical protein